MRCFFILINTIKTNKRKGNKMPLSKFYEVVGVGKCDGCDKLCDIGIKRDIYSIYDSEYAYFPVVAGRLVRRYINEVGKLQDIYCPTPEQCYDFLKSNPKHICEHYKSKMR